MPRHTVKRLNALSLLLGLAVAVPIFGCSQSDIDKMTKAKEPRRSCSELQVVGCIESDSAITPRSQLTSGVSKNCDELAQKYLETRFEKAAANNEGPPSQIAVVESSQSVEAQYEDDSQTFTGYLINLKTYNINQKGEISVFNGGVILRSAEKTAPLVVSSNQIVCRYIGISGVAKYTYNSENKTYLIKSADYINVGTFIQVSEDKDNLYWKEGF